MKHLVVIPAPDQVEGRLQRESSVSVLQRYQSRIIFGLGTSVSPCSGCARGHPSQPSHLALATAIGAPARPASGDTARRLPQWLYAAMLAPYSLRSSLAHAATGGFSPSLRSPWLVE